MIAAKQSLNVRRNPQEKVVDISVQAFRQYRQQVENIVFQSKAIGLSSFHQRIDHSAGCRAFRSIGKQPTLAIHNEGTDGILHLVVADLADKRCIRA